MEVALFYTQTMLREIRSVQRLCVNMMVIVVKCEDAFTHLTCKKSDSLSLKMNQTVKCKRRIQVKLVHKFIYFSNST